MRKSYPTSPKAIASSRLPGNTTAPPNTTFPCSNNSITLLRRPVCGITPSLDKISFLYLPQARGTRIGVTVQLSAVSFSLLYGQGCLFLVGYIHAPFFLVRRAHPTRELTADRECKA